MSDPLNWTAAIELQATAWQGAIPAELESPYSNGDYRVQMLAEHRLSDGGKAWPAGLRWRFDADGNSISFPDLRIVNRTAAPPPVDPLIAAAWAILDELGLGYSTHSFILNALREARDGAK